MKFKKIKVSFLFCICLLLDVSYTMPRPETSLSYINCKVEVKKGEGSNCEAEKKKKKKVLYKFSRLFLDCINEKIDKDALTKQKTFVNCESFFALYYFYKFKKPWDQSSAFLNFKDVIKKMIDDEHEGVILCVYKDTYCFRTAPAGSLRNNCQIHPVLCK